MRLHTFVAVIAGTLALMVGNAPSASADVGPERKTEAATRALLEAFERKDLDAIDVLIDQNATLTIPMSFSGALEPAAHFANKDEILGYIGGVVTNFRSMRFTDLRISVAERGGTSFAQANGDFITADGRPYRNVYIYRFDWKDGLMVHTDEYANPITLCQTLENLNC
ncbi:nuclear transport factor 2 family protein [Nocardia amikacinitolerans]|uniref:nuclear transport factor 2 family protein n=1 Tax=Nocardia amikacinitolerans TaxID=756689 RepID=UPI0020A455B8|nr:nuclear transport factor 2 family protein [Nocardia amikacinitolerans]MCP2280937.1 Ketosteroid isomerase-related protein [Nocardia amikacinitolerans]